MNRDLCMRQNVSYTNKIYLAVTLSSIDNHRFSERLFHQKICATAVENIFHTEARNVEAKKRPIYKE